MTLKNIFRYCFFLGLGVFFIWWSIKGLSPADKLHIRTALNKANFWWLIPGFSVLILSHWIRALRWRLLMEPLGYQPSKANTFFAVMIGYLANQAVPRLGEVLRCSTLNRYEHIPLDKLLGTVILERIIDAIVLLILFVITLLIQPQLYQQILDTFFVKKQNQRGSPLLLYGIIALAVIVVISIFWLAIKRKKPADLFNAIKRIGFRILEGVTVIRNLKKRGSFIFYTILMWGLYAACVFTGFLMLTEVENYGIKEALTVLCAGSLGMVATPGGIGAYAFLVQKTMHLYNLDNAIGLALGWLLWLLQTGAVLLVGGLSLLALPFYNKHNKGLA